MSYSEEHLDQLLRTDGERWRAAEPESRPFSVASLVRERGQRPSFGLSLGAGVSLGAVLLVTASLLAVYFAGPLGSTSQSPGPSLVPASSPTASPGPTFSSSTPPPTSSAGPPREIDGQPVLSTDELAREIASGNAASLLVAGTILNTGDAYCAVLQGETPPPALAPCFAGYLLWGIDGYGSGASISMSGIDFQGSVTPFELVVLRVHAYDSRANECPESYRLECQQQVVIDELVWSAVSASSAPTASPTPELTPSTSAWPTLGPDCYFSPGQVTVKFTAQLSKRSEQDAFATANGLREVSRAPDIGWIRYEITDGMSELDKASELQADPLVANAIPILVCHVPGGEGF